MMKGRIYIRTLGCPKNEADSSALIRHLEHAGWQVIDDPETADVEIVNTCGFIEATKIESLDALWEGVARKDSGGRGRRLIVTGCLAQRYSRELVAEIPELDAVVGFNRPDLMDKALSAPQRQGAPVCWVEKPGTEYREAAIPWAFDEGHPAPISAYIKVGDGCDHACRFCAIPHIRGKHRSRSAESILNEIRELVAHGTREVVLVSQDTTSWGADLDAGLDLASLLRQIDIIPGEFWVRLMYAHPACLTDRHVAAFADCQKIVPYLDMPLQHISDRMLTIMNRHTTRAKTEERIRVLRQARPDMALRTTFITGHPGETEADFEELLAFATETGFERMGVFSYSMEENTPAARMENAVPEELSRERADRLSIAYDRWSYDQSLKKVGQVIPSLLEERAEAGVWLGRTVHDAPEIDGAITVEDRCITQPGFYSLLVTHADGVDLAGQLPDGHKGGLEDHMLKAGTRS